MAIGSTIYKAQLTIANMDSHYYETHDLTLAQHPSETDERLMMQLVAFVFNASERLLITKGVGQEDEPNLWEKNYGDEIVKWIDLGQVDEKRLRKACGRSEEVIVYPYNLNSAVDWWKQNSGTFSRFKNLKVIFVHTNGVENLCDRTMRLQCNIVDGELTIHSEKGDISIVCEVWK